MKLSNTYVTLGEEFYKQTCPVPVKAPALLLWNEPLANQLGIASSFESIPQTREQIFSGNQLLPDSSPIALAYAGHQFGGFSPQLGDGRAHLLGEIVDPDQQRWDIQLKGSGQTPFSRRGDGRCGVGPAVREFLMSEAMQALGVPTTRSLAVVTTGEPVYRDTAQPGAVVTRIAKSHIRIGTFQYFSARNDLTSLKKLADYSIKRHYSEFNTDPIPYLKWLGQVMDRLIQLVVEWMRVGFIHGVMNTDNITLSAETIDYGPCAMLGVFDPRTVYSSIDHMKRYAFGNQPAIMQWNMYRFADCLIPLIDSNEKKAIEKVAPLLGEFSDRFQSQYQKMLLGKLGIFEATERHLGWVEKIQSKMLTNKLDYTQTFNNLTCALKDPQAEKEALQDLGEPFYSDWLKTIRSQSLPIERTQEKMRQLNPVVIPRNHHIEKILKIALEPEGKAEVESFLNVLRHPYQVLDKTPQFQDTSAPFDQTYKTFCGT